VVPWQARAMWRLNRLAPAMIQRMAIPFIDRLRTRQRAAAGR
jgi:hypothetical protein